LFVTSYGAFLAGPGDLRVDRRSHVGGTDRGNSKKFQI